MRRVFVRFLGESSARKKSFRDYLTFNNDSFYRNVKKDIWFSEDNTVIKTPCNTQTTYDFYAASMCGHSGLGPYVTCRLMPQPQSPRTQIALPRVKAMYESTPLFPSHHILVCLRKIGNILHCNAHSVRNWDIPLVDLYLISKNQFGKIKFDKQDF